MSKILARVRTALKSWVLCVVVALAHGVPVVQPNNRAFPGPIEGTSGIVHVAPSIAVRS